MYILHCELKIQCRHDLFTGKSTRIRWYFIMRAHKLQQIFTSLSLNVLFNFKRKRVYSGDHTLCECCLCVLLGR
uniref:Uncharacterized protein n=1 Tax=Anguilla anguilla TaxID=7936 RepID=A0A0E9W8Q3_ANGAN